METHLRSVAKTLSYRSCGAVVTGLVAWVVMGEVSTAVAIGIADTLVKLGAYYLHERLWNRISFGRPKPPEYQI